MAQDLLEPHALWSLATVTLLSGIRQQESVSEHAICY